MSERFQHSAANERAAELLRRRREELSEIVGDASIELEKAAQTVRDNPERTQEMLADIEMMARFLGETKDRIKTLEEHAAYDPITNLPNKRAFDEFLHMEVAHAKRLEGKYGKLPSVHVLGIDLDDFRGVNNTLGHDAGDLYLKTIGEYLRKALYRDTDIVARTGGDEFAAILLDCDESVAQDIAERLRKAVSDASAAAKKEYMQKMRKIIPANESNVTASIGSASLRAGETDTEETLFKRADQATYAAKEGGKNRVVLFADTLETGGDGEDGRAIESVA